MTMVAAPDFNFHRCWDKSVVRKLDDSAEKFLLDRPSDSGETGSFVTLEPQTDADGVNEIVTDQPGGDGERELRRGGGQEWVGGRDFGRVKVTPEPVDKTRDDREREKKREGPARSVEQTAPFGFPTSQSQPAKAEERSDRRPGEGVAKRVFDPERCRPGKEERKERGETGHPQVERGDPAPPLPPCRARAVTQGDGEKDHPAESDDHQ